MQEATVIAASLAMNPTTGSADCPVPGRARGNDAANNPARWTDPSGHAVGDVAALQGPIGVILEQVRALGQITIALMPALLALGMLANPIGLILAVQFILLATLLLMVVAQALLLVQDAFTFYDGLAPVEWAKEWTKDNLPGAPDEFPLQDCSLLTDEVLASLVQQLVINGGVILGAIMSMFGGCLTTPQVMGICFMTCVSELYYLPAIFGLLSGMLAACGLPVLDRHVKKLGGERASKGSSVCSKYLSKLLSSKHKWVANMPQLGTAKNKGANTATLGRWIGRTIPVIAGGILAADGIAILGCTALCTGYYGCDE